MKMKIRLCFIVPLVCLLLNLGIFVMIHNKDLRRAICEVAFTCKAIKTNQDHYSSRDKRTDEQNVMNDDKISSECDNMTAPKYVKVEQLWQHVSSNDDVYVFSAFDDGSYIRCLGSCANVAAHNLFCYLFYKDGETGNYHTHIVKGRMVFIPEDHGLRYSACFLMCPKPDDRIPHVLSLVDTKCQAPRNFLKIVGFQKINIIREFSVCVTPLHSNYSNMREIIEWLALNLRFGAKYFTFYDYSTAVNVKTVIDWFAQRGLAARLEWKIPTAEIHYYGQLVALNDCLYRNRFQSQYIVFLDLDEFIVPRLSHISTWGAMINILPMSGAYYFKNTFFRKEWSNANVDFSHYVALLNFSNSVTSLLTAPEIATSANKYGLQTLLNLHREYKIWTARSRSKQIVRSSAVETIGVHQAWRLKPYCAVHVVNGSLALLHHYRDWRQPKDRIRKVLDYTMIRFADGLISNVADIWNKLSGMKII